MKIAKYLFGSLPSQRRSTLDLRRTLNVLTSEQRDDLEFIVDAAGAVPAAKAQAVKEIWAKIEDWENPAGLGMLKSASSEDRDAGMS